MHGRRVENLRVARSAIFAFLAALLALLPGACRGGAGDAAPSCSAVAAKFLEIARFDLKNAKVDDATARAVTDQLPAMRDALAQACTEGAWSAAVRGCLARANDHAAVEACEQQLTDGQRRDLDRVSRGTPENP